MLKNFYFELSDDFKQKFPHCTFKYYAELINNRYRVIWNDIDGEHKSYYTINEVEVSLEKGVWIIVN